MRRCLVPPARVLVRLPSWLGDFVMAEPVVRALHERWTRAQAADRITLVGPQRFLALFAPFERSGVRLLALERSAPIDAIAWGSHDMALLLDGSWRSAWTACLARIPERVGFASGGRSALLTQAIAPARERGSTPLGVGLHGRWPRRLPRPFASACIELAAACGLPVIDPKPRLVLDPQALERVRGRLEQLGVARDARVVLVHAGAREGSAKGVPPDQWARILQALDHGDRRIVLTCAPGEEGNSRAVQALVPQCLLLDDPPLDVVELLAAHALADVVLTPDSGPRHLAQASSCGSVIVLCGPTDPRHTAEHAADVRVLRVEVDCGPCHRETCPLAGAAQHACMTRIDPRVVVDALASTPRKAPMTRVGSPA